MKTYIIALCLSFFFLACKKSKNSDPPPTPPPPEPKDTLLNWRKIPETAVGAQVNITDNWFANTTGVITTKHGIYKSTDGGNTWTGKLTSDMYNNLFFLQQQVGFAQGPSSFAFTLNGGDSWSTKTLAIPGARDIFFVSGSTGFLTSDNGLYKTTDTGNTWKKVHDKPAYATFFLDNANGFFYSEQILYKTSNAGLDWQTIRDRFFFSSSRHDWHGMQFIDNNYGFLFGATNLAFTIDGGKTWSARTFNNRITDVQFLTKDVGYVASGNEVLKSIDGGSTWTRSCKVGKGSIIEVYFVSPTLGWAVGDNGLILQLQ